MFDRASKVAGVIAMSIIVLAMSIIVTVMLSGRGDDFRQTCEDNGGQFIDYQNKGDACIYDSLTDVP